MEDYESVIKKETEIAKTINLKKLIGQKVLSDGGTIVGHVSEVRVNPDNFDLEGIVVSRSFENSIYIGKSYFSKLSNYSVILNTEISLLLIGKKVLTIDGKTLGKIKFVNRRGKTNDVESIVVFRLFRKYLIPVSEIKQVGETVLIKSKYNETKGYIWARPK